MTQIDKVLYTGKVRTTGGRDGEARSDDGRLSLKLSPPGSKGAGTNPEQLFAAGWSACYIGALGRAASKLNVALPSAPSVDAEVDLAMAGDAFLLRARLRVHIPGVDGEVARALVEAAHGICPYSKATRGNLHVETVLV
ncbi:organic hydroperoxide resistance protein [Cupriavidus sp. DB3]|uniref:organic hydroperoxide resistance protein n=1 Tax=Cupriavidus sp. DB3 TaxID=2873259 RepID=UPI001CF40376|nr:organic hydroperoxide resistance protein [Cupriavidus sp. DB3]MCA7086411.1 organic hydroperoxide resistance protein [Cupriavidus sp. DB3]